MLCNDAGRLIIWDQGGLSVCPLSGPRKMARFSIAIRHWVLLSHCGQFMYILWGSQAIPFNCNFMQFTTLLKIVATSTPPIHKFTIYIYNPFTVPPATAPELRLISNFPFGGRATTIAIILEIISRPPHSTSNLRELCLLLQDTVHYKWWWWSLQMSRAGCPIWASTSSSLEHNLFGTVTHNNYII